ncbi:hypothetical protein GALMADRAFT_208115 [Galerina marginata CBS 339.88]|uniref:F-box domain-containing protein n=1 Tax=Galerina marginata (strain CBS 339.88) TaxID=685588 RepID=A0A067T9B1_GALM3|nr:hypothetical protein GALMADRAFT_208115 [Galerina marginata CBS 339.88]
MTDALSRTPLDIQISIIKFLDPYDILQLRKTCRSLYCATMQITIWMEALHRVCIRNSTFRPSFSLESMSRLALEHAATAPRRWIALASRTSDRDRPIPPYKTSYLKPTASEILERCATLYLVPGGRFLVTVSWNMVAVWDLDFVVGLGLHVTQFMEPLALTKLTFTGMFLVHPTPDDLGLRILLSALEPTWQGDFNGGDLPETFLVYEIYPQSENPQLRKIAELQKSGENISFFCHSLDRLVFLQGATLNIWDYKADAWASWTVPGDYDQILVDQSSIILLYRSGVSVWSIPPLSPSKPPFSDADPPSVPPHFTLLYPDLGSVWCEGPCDWYSGSPQPHIYDLIEVDGIDFPIKSRRYEVVLGGHLKSAELAERWTFAISRSADLKFESGFFCENTLVSWWFDSASQLVKVHTGSTFAAGREAASRKVIVDETLTLLQTHDIWKGCVGLCPVSARFLYLDTEKGIRVLDYLPSPNSQTS